MLTTADTSVNTRKRHKNPRALFWIFSTISLIGVVIAFIFERAARLFLRLGPKRAMDNLRYALAVYTDFKLCRGQDEFRYEIARLERAGAGRCEGPLEDQKTYAHLLVNADRSAEAEKLYEELFGRHPDDPELFKSFGLMLLRRAEVENCSCHTGICIYPLPRPHMQPRDAARAREMFERAIAIRPTWNLRWLSHVAGMAQGAIATALPFSQKEDGGPLMPRLVEGGRAAGVDKLDLGRGVVMGDFDGDGRLDIVEVSSLFPSAYFHNRGDRTFEDRSEASGLGAIRHGFIVAAGDIDNDGALDLYISRAAFFGREHNVMLHNDGHGNFTDVSVASGTANDGAGFVAAFADYDNDGHLDLFVSNFSSPLWYPNAAVDGLYGRKSNVLYHNRGDGTFEDVTEKAGLTCSDMHIGATWGDVNDDGYPDLYVTTLYGPNHLYINQGDGTFVDMAEEAGVAEPWPTFASWFFDYDGDGHLDLLVTSHASPESVSHYLMTGTPPPLAENMRLYHNDGTGHFEDVTTKAGLRLACATMGANWGDLNNDGWPDFYLGTGGPGLDRLEPNLLFINRGDGTFWNATYATKTGYLQKGHGVAFGDLDGDGWQDFYAALGGAWPVDTWVNALHWNETGRDHPERHFVKVVLRGHQSNSHGVGARVIATIGQRQIMREINGGNGFGVNPFLAEIGLGTATTIDALDVIWPGRKRRHHFENLPVDVTVMVDEERDKPLLLDPRVAAPMFRIPWEQLESEYGAKRGR
ncbi:MAG TPA: CRTAC1 family protein [Thermoanaerobaculia bacterium]|nr:CRTAC1 family protein [Thermoanaerobaculia bacterium]